MRGLDERDTDGSGATGVFFHEQTPEALIEAIERFEANVDRFDPQMARASAERFDKAVFKERVSEAIDAILRQRRPTQERSRAS